MSFLKSVFGTKSFKPGEAILRATGASSARYNMGNFGLGQVGDWDYDRAVGDALERVTWVYRCVDVIAQKQSTLPIQIRNQYGSEDGQVLQDKQLERLLNFRANSYETAQQFRYRLSAVSLLSRRGAFIEVIRDRNGRPTELHLLPPGSTKPIPDPRKFVSGYELIRGDGTTEVIPPENVIWVRIKPHPNDVYAQLTPLTTAGISIETELIARMFNRNFIANDGRPSMLINVEGEADPESLNEIRARFDNPIPGQTSVINADGITVADLANSPRDLQWTELLSVSKEEILMAFGVPESVMGNASGRTFDNADAEREMFYVDTMQPHCNSIASGLDRLTENFDDDVVPAYDYSGIAVLQRVASRKRDEWRKEFKDGLRTVDEYRTDSKMKPFGVAGTRILITSSNIGIASNDEDQEELTKYQMLGTPAPMDDMGDMGGDMGAGDPMAGDILDEPQAPVNLVSERAFALAQKTVIRPRNRTPRTSGRRIESKSLDGADDDADRVKDPEYLKGLDSFLDKVTEQFIKSLSGIENKDLRSDFNVDRDTWRNEIQNSIMKSIQREAMKEARMASREMQDDGIINQMDDERGFVSKGSAIERVFGSMSKAYVAIRPVNEKVARSLWDASNAQFDRVEAKIIKMKAEGKTKREIRVEIRRMIGARSVWRANLKVDLTTTSVEGARHAVYSQAGRKVRKVWHCQPDERTRPTHVKANGQQRTAKHPFTVGKAKLQFPGDPTTEHLEEIMGCRCWIEWVPAGRRSKAPAKPKTPPVPPVAPKPVPAPTGQRTRPVIRKANANRKKRKR